LTFTFAVVALAWRRPPFDPLPRWTVAITALLFTFWAAIAALFGPQDARNPLPGVFYVLWVGLVALSLVVEPVWRAISPVRCDRRVRQGITVAARRSSADRTTGDDGDGRLHVHRALSVVRRIGGS
jgi:hypothetical protein